jgi:dihydrofolate reductase
MPRTVADRVLMGANTYRLMSGLASEGEPGTDELAAMSKVVFSRTLREPLAWANTHLVTEDPVEAVGKMKGEEGIDSRTFDGRIQLLEYAPKVLAGP